MSAYSRGKVTGFSHPARVSRLTNNDPLVTSQQRVGKQSLYGSKKGSQPPGQHWNYARNLGGK